MNEKSYCLITSLKKVKRRLTIAENRLTELEDNPEIFFHNTKYKEMEIMKEGEKIGYSE